MWSDGKIDMSSSLDLLVPSCPSVKSINFSLYFYSGTEFLRNKTHYKKIDIFSEYLVLRDMFVNTRSANWTKEFLTRSLDSDDISYHRLVGWEWFGLGLSLPEHLYSCPTAASRMEFCDVTNKRNRGVDTIKVALQ
jgi:hypothetical protein